jgi:CRP-like cAMP-binding protein
MSDERKKENEEEKLKDFFHNVIGIKSEAVLEVLAENSEICNLKARTLLMKENEKVFPGNLSGAGKKVNKKDIASYLNMTPECFSRMLKKYDGA